jgi:hypothetical protein
MDRVLVLAQVAKFTVFSRTSEEPNNEFETAKTAHSMSCSGSMIRRTKQDEEGEKRKKSRKRRKQE